MLAASRTIGGALALAATLLATLLSGPAQAAEPAPERLCTRTTIPTSDGVRLHAWVSRLAPDRARPVLFMMDTYARTGGTGPDDCPSALPDDNSANLLARELSDRFTLVRVAYRGTGASEGSFDFTGPRTQADIDEAIRWAARQPWSSGALTLIGSSGTGFFAHHALEQPSVSAAVMFTSCADMYRCMRTGGGDNGLTEVYLLRTILGYAGSLGDRIGIGALLAPDPLSQLSALLGGVLRPKLDSAYSSYWAERSSLPKLPHARVPVLYTADLYDIVQPFDAVQLTPGARLSLGIGHTSAEAMAAAGPRFAELIRRQVDRFVAHYGLGERNGAERDGRVTLVTNLGGVEAYRRGHVLVRSEPSWPLPGTDWTRLHLAGGPSGSARSRNDGTLTVEPPPAGAQPDRSPLLSLPLLGSDRRTSGFVLGANQPSDLREEERGALTYTTPAFTEELEVSGPIALRLFAATTVPDLDWTVRIADVWPDGRSEWITDGSLRATLRAVDPERSLRDPRDGSIVRPWHPFDTREAVPRGEPVEYQVDVTGTSNVFRAGHRLRLSVVPGKGPRDTPLALGAISVLRDAAHPSSLSLPVIPDRCGRSEPLLAGGPKPAACARSYADAVAER